MVNFKKTHNITNEQNFRSLIGYAGQELAISRLMMCGFNVLRSLWRDSKYDGMFEANDASIKTDFSPIISNVYGVGFCPPLIKFISKTFNSNLHD